jgi:hypothetical protein
MSPEQNELLRQATLDVLVACHPVPRAEYAIRRLVSREVAFPFNPDDQFAALEFLRGLALVTFESDKLGSTRWWTATSAAVLEVERRR